MVYAHVCILDRLHCQQVGAQDRQSGQFLVEVVFDGVAVYLTTHSFLLPDDRHVRQVRAVCRSRRLHDFGLRSSHTAGATAGTRALFVHAPCFRLQWPRRPFTPLVARFTACAPAKRRLTPNPNVDLILGGSVLGLALFVVIFVAVYTRVARKSIVRRPCRLYITHE